MDDERIVSHQTADNLPWGYRKPHDNDNDDDDDVEIYATWDNRKDTSAMLSEREQLAWASRQSLRAAQEDASRTHKNMKADCIVYMKNHEFL
ncbi:hypothetical protein PV325_009960 [Microctonus aethiopoides]|nr:hypothetical protein PV325_009960 [Microctonus aethiopoides]